jgi:hypothetical protein
VLPHRPVIGLLLVLGLQLAGCREKQGSPARPARVPREAFWLAGPDGGVFVAVQKRPQDPPPLYQVRIFYPYGEPWYEGPLTVEPTERADVDLSDPRIFVGWDGERLLLSDGRALRPTRRRP